MYDSIVDTIGSPLVRIDAPEGATVAAKIEAANPGGSAKDRPARQMILDAEEAGEIQPGDQLVEPTSGNTGIGLSMVAAARGYDMIIVMPEGLSEERRQIMEAFGADIEFVDGDMTAARECADEIEESGAFQPGQFVNESNPQSHVESTAPEIIEAVGDRTIDAFVAGIGTGGTITGTGRTLAAEFPDMDIIGIEPERNAVISTGESGDDDFQGMGPGFVSEITDVNLLDSAVTVPLEDAEAECRRLAREEGILVGQSSGAASLVAKQTAKRLLSMGAENPLVVTVFPDSGERYMSTGMFTDPEEDA